MRDLFLVSSALLFSVLATSCGSPARVCAPGASVACVGPAGCTGGQVCNADGAGFGTCVCTGGDAGLPDSGMTDSGMPDTGTPDTGMPDTGTPDTGTPDLGKDAGSNMVCDTGLTLDPPECAMCVGSSCCAELHACIDDPACNPCTMDSGMPGCDSDPLFTAFANCANMICSGPCSG